LIWQWTPRKLNKEADLLTRHALHAIRSNTENYLAAVQTIDPDNPLKLTKKERIDRSLLDLRVYRPLGLLA
jgi:hypothetical protein